VQRLNAYDYYIEMQGAGGSARHVRIEDDTIALAVDATAFSALCEGRLAPGGLPGQAVIEPVWEREDLSPYLVGLEVTIVWNDESGENSYTRRFDKSPFHPRAKQLAAALIQEELQAQPDNERPEEAAGPKYVWKVMAIRKAAGPPAPSRKFSAGAEATAFPIQTLALEDFGLRWPGSPEPFSVFVASSVIGEIQDRTRALEGRAEQAGVLIGRLGQESGSNRLFAVVTAHLEAEVNVEAGRDSFKFTAETFIEIHRRIRLRQSGEIVLGWQHSHHYCPTCPANTSGTTIFFSAADISVQAAAFRSPYMVALVAGRDLDLEPFRPAVKMFGWSGADMVPRRFHEFESQKEAYGSSEARIRTVGAAV
jgi:hypothetical protein